ncbi:Toxin CcdB [Burkholderiales bacterium 8X]|nr:Toxin CcdB [Burkholderiales bacterium 8X]
MARFDVYANPDEDFRSSIPFILDVQNDFLGALETRVVVPLHLQNGFKKPIRNLNPQLQVSGKIVIMDTASLAAIPIRDLRRPLANLAGDQGEIQDALDTLFGPY